MHGCVGTFLSFIEEASMQPHGFLSSLSHRGCEVSFVRVSYRDPASNHLGSEAPTRKVVDRDQLSAGTIHTLIGDLQLGAPSHEEVNRLHSLIAEAAVRLGHNDPSHPHHSLLPVKVENERVRSLDVEDVGSKRLRLCGSTTRDEQHTEKGDREHGTHAVHKRGHYRRRR